ncbi:hypothetical protein MKW98_009200, partial [Papaver atlanticum]
LTTTNTDLRSDFKPPPPPPSQLLNPSKVHCKGSCGRTLYHGFWCGSVNFMLLVKIYLARVLLCLNWCLKVRLQHGGVRCMLGLRLQLQVVMLNGNGGADAVLLPSDDKQ